MNRFTPYLQAVRAISATFARRMFLPIILIIGSVLVVLLILGGWLTTLSGWWWILEVFLIGVTLLYGVVSGIGALLLYLLDPVQTKQQRKDVKAFVDKLQEASEVIQTPKFFIFFRLVKDTVRPTKRGLITQVTSHVVTLRPDFESIVTSFK